MAVGVHLRFAINVIYSLRVVPLFRLIFGQEEKEKKRLIIIAHRAQLKKQTKTLRACFS